MPTVNQDYLCLISVNDGKTTFERADIPQSEELVGALTDMAANPDRTVLDLQSRMDLEFSPGQRGYINYVSPYGYQSSYITGTVYPPSRTNEEYCHILEQESESAREKFAEQNENLREDPNLYAEKMKEYVDRRLEVYKSCLKADYLSQAKRFIMANNYRNTLTAARSRQCVRMYSTDTLGWSSFTYPVTDDVIITIGTNFGYGGSSYFHLGLRYKGIDILPYSFMVNYYYADQDDLIRYTRRYVVNHESWNNAFEFVERMANLAAGNPDAFVKEVIVNEVREMVEGLRSMLPSSNVFMKRYLRAAGNAGRKDYETVRNMTRDEVEKYRVYPGEMGMVIKAEKATGALDFLDNLRCLSETVQDIEVAIGEIIEMAKTLLPQIEEMMSRLESDIASLDDSLKVEEANLDMVRAELKPHLDRISQLYEARRENDKSLQRSMVEEEYGRDHEEFLQLKGHESEVSGRISRLREEKRQREAFRNHLDRCVSRVERAGLRAAA